MPTGTMEEVVSHFGIDDCEGDIDLISAGDYNIAPGSNILVVLNTDRGRILTRYRWGLVPSWAKDASIGNRMINARAETLPEKSSFKQALARRRCLVVASGYYEWMSIGDERIPFYIYVPSQPCIAFAGLHEVWVSPEGEELRTCIIITTESCSSLQHLHPRMPLILAPKNYSLWLSRESSPGEINRLLQPYSGRIGSYRVSSLVNKQENDSPQCIEPD